MNLRLITTLAQRVNVLKRFRPPTGHLDSRFQRPIPLQDNLGPRTAQNYTYPFIGLPRTVQFGDPVLFRSLGNTSR
jgi:hypothetical protein